MNICEHLTATARIFPDRIALQFEGRSFTYAQLDRMSLAASHELQASNIRPGDRVAIMLPNVPAFIVWYYAALRIGAIAVSISTRSAPAEVAYLLEDCEAKFFVADQLTLQKVESSLPSCVIHHAFTSEDGDTRNDQILTRDAKAQSTWYSANPSDAALILYTSGTTGFVKGATLSHLNVRSNVHAFNHLCQMQPEDRILLAVPLFHCFGQNALLNSALNVGATLVMQRRFDLNETKHLITSEGITQLYGVPMMFQMLLDSCEESDLSSVQYCFSAAAPLPIQISTQWQQKFGMPINEGYGLTETSPFASYNHRLQYTPGSIGAPIDSVEMKIVDVETGEQCVCGELGEIAIRGPNVMLGYWNKEEDTQAAIRDGWFHSGDLGRIDDRGYFYIVDRVKEMISVGGMKVYPAEVERVLLDHPSVMDVGVVGIHDDVFGEQVVAFVVLPENELSVDEHLAVIKQYAMDNLANYKVPRLVVPIEELPRNPAGKVLKRKLKEFKLSETPVTNQSPNSGSTNTDVRRHQLQSPSIREKLKSAPSASRSRTAVEFVQNLVKKIAGKEVSPEANDGLLDYGLDSLMIVEVSNQIQVELGAEHQVPATLVFDHPRVCDLSDYLLSTLFPSEDLNATKTAVISPKIDTKEQIENMSEEEALRELMKELSSK